VYVSQAVLLSGIVCVSIVICYPTVSTCSHWSCMCDSDVLAHTVDLFPRVLYVYQYTAHCRPGPTGLVCVSVVICYHTLSTCSHGSYMCVNSDVLPQTVGLFTLVCILVASLAQNNISIQNKCHLCPCIIL